MLLTEREDMLNTSFSEIEIGIPELSLVSSKSGLAVYVVFTSIDLTLKALQKARDIAGSLRASIVIVAVQAVPFPLQLDTPPVSMEFVIKRFEEKAGELGEKTSVSAYLCRDPMNAFRRILNPGCPVVIGLKKRLWPTRNERLARKLRRAGYDVISVNQE
jgi:hypothetical protein